MNIKNKIINKNSNITSDVDVCKLSLNEAKIIYNKIIKNKNKNNVISQYNEIAILLDSAMSKAILYSNVHPIKNVRDYAEKYEKKISTFITKMSLNFKLYTIFNNIKINQLDLESKRLVIKILQNFKRSGVNKSDETRKLIEKIQKELIIISQNFGKNIREDVRFISINSKYDLDGLPDDYINSKIKDKNQSIKITTNYPDYIPFMMYAKNEKLRKELWKKSLNRGHPKNKIIFNKMLKKRYELAKILGYKSYAHYVLENKMIKTPLNASNFIKNISKRSEEKANIEYNQLLNEKRKKYSKAKKIMGYEKLFYEEKIKKNKFKFDSQILRSYFQVKNVLNGIINITSDLFNVTYKENKLIKTWHKSVIVYDIYEKENKLGTIFLDLYIRKDKYKHAAQFTIKSGILNKQLPEGALVCNFTDLEESNNYQFMNHDEIITLFHEFGHILHHIFAGKQKYIMFSGVATEFDFVEVPSQILEELAWDSKIMQKISKHYITGEKITLKLLEKMKNANNFGKALNTLQQIFYSSLSLEYYRKNPKLFNTYELLIALQKKYSKIPYEKNTHFNLSFGHLDDYSAMYYTYTWSKVIAIDLLSSLKEDETFNRKNSLNYKDKILSNGGSKDAVILIKDFLNRSYNFNAFSKWLSI